MSENRQGDQEGFLTRWSRRKTLSRQGEELPEPAEEADGEHAASPVAQDPALIPEDSSSEPAAEAAGVPEETTPELPPLESLDEDSDYSAFLGDGVPADVKQKALHKLFHSPKFNIRDGLDDYDWDFTNPEPLGDIITAEMRYRRGPRRGRGARGRHEHRGRSRCRRAQRARRGRQRGRHRGRR
jgi:hypothetical protein